MENPGIFTVEGTLCIEQLRLCVCVKVIKFKKYILLNLPTIL